jgi:D-serine deaminase-like pyridoxal phosphate-dependent protein
MTAHVALALTHPLLTPPSASDANRCDFQGYVAQVVERSPATVADLPTPAAIVDLRRLDANIAAMAARWPGDRLRPHVKAFKSTALAGHLARAGHASFCCATVREMEGMAAAGLGHDLLLANEVLDASRLRPLVDAGARVTMAVDSDRTIAAAADAGITEVLIDVNVGLPRCGCDPDDAARLAAHARGLGLDVRGVMGYEGHIVGIDDRRQREAGAAASMALLARAHEEVGGAVISGGATGTWDCNTTVTELQAGSFTLMDTAYARLDLPFLPALAIIGTTVSRSAPRRGRPAFAVADVGLKALGMDHGNPAIDDADVWFCSDEHVTFAPDDGAPPPDLGHKVAVWPAHVDPTVASHERLWIVQRPAPEAPLLEAEIVDQWPVDLRGW